MKTDFPIAMDAPPQDNTSEFILRARAAERPADPLVSCLLPAFNEEGNILPLYASDNLDMAKKSLFIIESEREERNLKQVKLLGELSND